MNQQPPQRAIAVAALAVALLLTSVGGAHAQYIPYYGKNKVKYDNFSWRIYKSPHFEVFYYPEFEQHLSRLSSYLESSYQKVSSELKHEIPFSIPVIMYKTHSEFEQTNLFPAFVPEGVLAFAEPVRDRMVLPIDLAPDKLQGLITHELTHIFEFDLIPRNLIQRGVPLWVDEGLADYVRGTWAALDLMMVRDAAVADQIPHMTQESDLSSFGNVRLTYNLGHAVFEHIEDRYGKEGIRQFIYTLRKNVVGGNAESIYQQAFRTTPEEFDKGFEKWLKERFKPYRDKQRPDDYGADLAPDAERTQFTQVYGFSPSPSGDLVAAITGNRSEGEVDVLLLSAKDGGVVKNLTKGFTGRWEHITMPDEFVAGRSLDFSPRGDVVAFFARSGKRRTLFLISAIDGSPVAKFPMALDQAASPCITPDGRHVLFAAMKEGVSDIYALEVATGETRNLTRDDFADTNPRVSPDGHLVAYNRRISGSEKIVMFPITKPDLRTQVTFGAHDDAAPWFSSDGKRLYYASNEDDDIFNLRGIDLETGIVRQYTDALGGNMAPATLASEGGADRVAFISYAKGSYGLNAVSTEEALKEVDQAVELAAAEILDFQPDVTHQVVPENKRRKTMFEGLYLEGRPPLNVGVTSSGDLFGGTQVALTDVLGDQSFLFTALSLREFRSYSADWLNLAGRLQYGASAFDNTRFFFSQFAPTFSFDFRNGLLLTQRYQGLSFRGIYPLDKFRRLVFSASALKIRERFDDPFLQFEYEEAVAAGAAAPLRDGYAGPVSGQFVQETTRFHSFGPLSGSTVLLGGAIAPALGGNLSYRTAEADARKYLRLGSTTSLLAVRARGFHSSGEAPEIFYFGGNMELRGYPYLAFAGNQGFFANVELRLPVIHLALTPLGLIGPIRGSVYFGIGGAKFKGQEYTFSSSDPGRSFVNAPSPEECFFDPTPECLGEPVDGFHLVDGRASYGFGLQVFFAGYPLHFDWTKLTDLQVTTDYRFSFWVGYDY